MKKFLSFMLAAMLTLTSLGTVSFAAENDAADETSEDAAELTASFVSQITENGSAIPNTYAKMKSGQDINLGYFGGSVTNGYGPATQPIHNGESVTQGNNCWRGLSQTWLQQTYGVPNDVTFMETSGNRGTKYHAGLGGTGVDLNLYRADNQLGLSTDDPVDLLFIEFSINDSYEGNSYEKSAFFMESLIKEVRTKSPTTDIVIILTTDHGKLAGESNGGTTPHMNAQAHIDVAEYYGIPWFWFGEYIYDFMVAENEKLTGNAVLPSATSELWYTYFSDGCHPHIKGYEQYFNFLRDNFLIPNLDDTKGYTTTVANYTCPEVPYNATQEFLDNNKKYHPNSNSVYYNARLRSNATDYAPGNIRNFGTPGYGYNPASDRVVMESYNNAGMSFSIKVKAQSAGMYFKGHPTQGMIQYRVDGGDWQYANMYKSSNDQNEYFMFYENLEEKEHIIDVILRKTLNGDDWLFKSLFVEGDSEGFGAEILKDAPNNMPLNDIVKTPIVLTPTLLNTKITGTNFVNSGTSFSVYHLGITDTDVLRYTPNPASSHDAASDCYNSTIKSVSIPEYKYAVIKYYYELEPGTTEANVEGKKQSMNFLQLPSGNPKSVNINSADTIILGGTSAHKSIIDLNAITARTGHTGNLAQFHFYPFGSGVKGSDLVSTEIMNIESIMFYADYPYEDEYEIDVALDKTITSEAQEIDLSGKRILPSAHRYALVKYTAAEEANLTFGFDGLYGGNYSASKATPAGTGEIIMNLTEIAESGQTDYYTNVKLSADKEIDIESITFSVNYPDPEATFTVSFDANGGEGTIPKAVTGKIGHMVTLPAAALEKGTQLFLGWATSPDATEVVSEYEIPVDGATLYAVYADAATLTYNANGGKGTAPAPVKVLVGRETTLVGGGSLTKEKSVFIGWGLTADATTPVASITMDEDGATVYAIYKELQTVYVTNDESGKLTYNGEEITADYATLGEALKALGTNGGHIIFDGGFEEYDFFLNQNSSAPIVILEGASDNAILRCEATGAVNAKLLCNTTLRNVTILRGINTNGGNSDTYINGNGKELVLDVGTTTHNEAGERGSYQIGSEEALQGYTFKKLVVNDGKLSNNFHLTQYGNNSSGNVYYEVNGGTPGTVIQAGTLRFGDGGTNTHTGNITVVVNGGNLSNGHRVLIDKNAITKTIVSGATTVIVNNGLADSKSMVFDSKFQYVIKSSLGGTATLAAEGSSSYAPTFLLKANRTDGGIKINGEEVEAVDGEYLFMPKSSGTFEVVYTAATKVYANSDGSGKLTVDGVEHTAYDTITEAAANLDANGGTIYFDGEQSFYDFIELSKKGYKYLTIRGTSANSILQFDVDSQPGEFGCDITIENCKMRKSATYSSPYLRTGANVITIGNANDTIPVEFLASNGSAASIEAIVTQTGGKFVVNSGYLTKIGRDWSGTHSSDVQAEINGGKVDAAGLRPYYGGSGTLNGNFVITINGGTINGTTINPENGCSVTGNSIIIFNNGTRSNAQYTISNVDYVVDAPAGIKVEATSFGSASVAPTFTLTPSADVEKIFVNRAEVTPVGGVYTYTPTATGTFIVEADLVLPTVTFDKGDATSGTAPGAVAGEAGVNVTIPACDLAKDGKRLCGWATTAGKTDPEYTTTIKMPEGGITLYPVWRDADIYYVTNEASGTVTYGGVTYRADYEKLSDAIKAMGTSGHIVFTGAFDYNDFFIGNTSVTDVILEGADDDAILSFESTVNASTNSAAAVNAYFYYNVTFKNVKLLKAVHTLGSPSDLYFNGNGKTVILDKTETYTETGKDTNVLNAESELQGYDFGKIIVNDGKLTNNFHLLMQQANSSGNRYYEINGTASAASPIQLGALQWRARTDTHTGNITLVINGGTFGAEHQIRVDKDTSANKLTNVNGAVSVVINNGIADTTAFTIDSKVEYVIKSAKGGAVTLAQEGSETAAPSFLIRSEANKAILINNEKVEDVNGEYTFTPSEKGTFVVTYEEKPTNVNINVSFNGKSETSKVVVNAETGFDGRAVLTIEGMAPIYLENANDAEADASETVSLKEGTYTFTVKKPGYITYEGVITVNGDGTFDMDEIPTLIAGDITDSFEETVGDGIVDLDDFIRVLRGFAAAEGDKRLRQFVDLNEDGNVNVQDLAIIKVNYGKTADDYAE